MEKIKQNKIQILLHIFTLMGTILLILFIGYGIKENLFTSPEALSAFLQKIGIFGPLLFIVLQIVQVIFPIIPGGVSCAVGVLVFGPFWGFVYNYFSILLGSIIVFLISKKYGMRIIKKLFKKQTIEKYIGWLDKESRFSKLFAFAIFMPVAPDDFLCYLAGITKMSLKKFVTIIVLCKPISILAYSFSLAYISNLVIQIFH